MDDLFLPSTADEVNGKYPKQASVTLPADENKWVETIVNELHMRHPEMGDYPLEVNFNAKNTHEGAAVGTIKVSGDIDIPFVIDRFKLQPFDAFQKDGELLPLTNRAVSEALQERAFGELITPGRGEVSDSFLTNALPPFDGKYTFAGLGAYDKTSLIDILSNANDELVSDALYRGEHIRKLAKSAKPSSLLKTASHEYAKTAAKEITPDVSALVIKDQGLYDLISPGAGKTACYVFDRYLEKTGKYTDSKFVVAMDGSGHSYIEDCVTVDDAPTDIDLSKLAKNPVPGSTYAFVYKENEKWNSTQPTYVKLAASGAVTASDGITYRADPNIKHVVKVGKDIYLPGVKLQGLPLSANSLKLASLRLIADKVITNSLCIQHHSHDNTYSVKNAKHAAFNDTMPRTKAYNLLKRYYDDESVNAALNKAARFGSVFINNNIVPEELEKKLLTETRINDIRIKTAEHAKMLRIAYPDSLAKTSCVESALLIDANEKEVQSYLDIMSKVLLKQANELDEMQGVGGQDAVDSLLSMHSLNEETVYKYLDQLDALKQARTACLRMLLASRIGLPVPAAPLRSAAFALDEVIHGLERLRHVSGSRR